MSVIAYPFSLLIDDAGSPLLAPTVTIASITDKAGNPLSTGFGTINAAYPGVSVDYDAELHGEAWITLTVSESGHTVTGLNAAPMTFAAKDSSRILLGLSATGKVALDPAQAWDFNTPAVTHTTARLMQLLEAQCGGKWGPLVVTGATSGTITLSDETGVHPLLVLPVVIDQTDPANIKIISRG